MIPEQQGVYKSSETAGNVSCILDMFGIRGKSEDEFSSKRHLKVVMRGCRRLERKKIVLYLLETWRGFPFRSYFDRDDPWCAEKPLFWKLDQWLCPSDLADLHSSVVTEWPQPCNYLAKLKSHTCTAFSSAASKDTFEYKYTFSRNSRFDRNPRDLEFHREQKIEFERCRFKLVTRIRHADQ